MGPVRWPLCAEALITALDELERVYTQAKADPKFHKEFMTLQQRYVAARAR